MGFKWKSLLPAAAGALTGGVMGQFAKTAPYAAAGSAAAGTLTNKKNPLAGAAMGATGGAVGGAVGGGIKGAFQNTSSNPFAGFGGGAMEGLKSYGSSIPGFGGIGTSNPTGVMAKFLTPQSIQGQNAVLKNGTNMYTPMGSGPSSAGGKLVGYQPTKLGAANMATTAATGSAAPSGATGKGINFKNLFNGGTGGGSTGGMNIPGMAAGAGVSMLGNMFAPKVEAPNFSGVTEPIKAMITNPNSDTAAAAQYYKTQMNAPVGGDAADARAVSALRNQRQKEQDIKSLTQQFMAANPGVDINNNSAYRDTLLNYNRDFLASEEAQNAQIQFEYDNQQRANKSAAAAAVAQMDQAQIQSLVNLAQLDVNSIMLQTGMDYSDAQATKQLGATLGEIMMTSAAGGYNQAQVPNTAVKTPAPQTPIIPMQTTPQLPVLSPNLMFPTMKVGV